MLAIHPPFRTASGALFVLAVFTVKAGPLLFGIYAVALGGVAAARAMKLHARFVLATLPMLLGLLVMWGWLKPLGLHGDGSALHGVHVWIRVVACGAALQGLFVPLARHPENLRDFAERSGLGASLTTVVVSSVVFLPEIKRRLELLVDARRAQGHPVRGLTALRELPTLLMPLVSSLLDSAARRAELWTHRGILQQRRNSEPATNYDSRWTASVIGIVLATAVVALRS